MRIKSGIIAVTTMTLLVVGVVGGLAITGVFQSSPVAQAEDSWTGEAITERLQGAVDNGRLTQEQADKIRAKVESGDGFGFRGKQHRVGAEERAALSQEFTARVGDILQVDGEAVLDAMQQVRADMTGEAITERLQGAVDNGRLTQEQADKIRAKVEAMVE